MTLVQVDYRAQSPVDLFSRAKPAATARGLEVSISRSGPPQPTDSEQQGQLWGCRTPLLGKALRQKHINKHDKELRFKKNKKIGKLFHVDYGCCFQHGKQAGILSKSHSLNIQVDFHMHNVVGYLMWPILWFVYLSEISFSRSVRCYSGGITACFTNECLFVGIFSKSTYSWFSSFTITSENRCEKLTLLHPKVLIRLCLHCSQLSVINSCFILVYSPPL